MHEQSLIQKNAAPVFQPMPSGLLQRQCACGNHSIAGGECDECQKKREGMLQRSDANAAPVNEVPPIVYEVLRSAGQPLDAATRAFMEPRFGYDFSNVRVHTDAKAAESARAVNALAYTVERSNDVFEAGQHLPETRVGQKVIAYELTHGVQQSGMYGNYIGQGNENRILFSNLISNDLNTSAIKYKTSMDGAKLVNGIQLQREQGPVVDAPQGCRGSEVPCCREFVERAERSLGVSLGDVRMHTGDGVAERHAAAAITHGQDIHFADATIHPERGPEPSLFGHELAHVVQQRSPARGSRLEQEAESGGRALASSQPFNIAGGTGGAMVQAKGFLEWFAENTFWANSVQESRTAEKQLETENAAQLTPKPQMYYGSNTPIVDETGKKKQVPTKGEFKHEDKWSWSWVKNKFGQSEGTEKYSTSSEGARTIETDTKKKEIGLEGIEVQMQKGARTEVVDVAATARVAKKQLEQELEEAKQELVNLKEKDPVSEAALKRVKARQSTIEESIKKIEANPDDGVMLKGVCEAHRLLVEPAYKNVSNDMVTEKMKLEFQLWKGKAEYEHQTETNKPVQGDAVDSSVAKKIKFGVDLSEGEVKWGDSEETKKTLADGSVEKSIDPNAPAQSSSVKVGSGAAVFKQEKSYGTSRTGPDDKPVNESKKIEEKEYGIIANEKEGFGIKAGSSSKNVTVRGDESVETSSGGHIGITDKGILGDVSAGSKGTYKKLQGERKVSGDGAILVEVKPPEPDADPALYQIVTTIRVGLALNASIGTKKEDELEVKEGAKSKGGVSAQANAGAEMVYTHQLTRDRAMAYMDEVDKFQANSGAKASAEYPEFEILAKLNLLADGEVGANPASILGSSSSAERLKPGDSIELILTAGASGKANISRGSKAYGAGVEGIAGFSYTRTLQVARDQEGKMILTVGFIRTDKLAGSLSGTIEAVTMSGGASQATSEGDKFVFKLDPSREDYKDCYDRIIFTPTREQLKALANDEKIKAHLIRATTSSSHNEGTNASIGVPGIALKSGQEHFGSQEISKMPEGFEGKYEGGVTSKFAVAPGVDAFAQNTTNSATATVDNAGALSVDLKTKTKETNLSTTLANAGKTIKGWFGVKDAKETTAKDVIKGVVEKKLGERITELLEMTYTRLAGYKLSPQDVDIVIARAADERKWLNCCTSPKALVPMQTLRNELLYPSYDIALVTDQNNEAQVSRATKLAQAKSIADFMETAGEHGMKAIINVLRNWGAWTGRESTAQDLGTRYEWPDVLRNVKAQYDRNVAKLQRLPEYLTKLLDQPDSIKSARVVVDKIIGDFDFIYKEVRASSEIHSERVRAEMLDEISAYKAQAIAEQKDFEHLAFQNSNEKIMRGENASPLLALDADVKTDKPILERFAVERIKLMLLNLQGFKATERQMLHKGWKAVYDKNFAAARKEMHRLRDLYDFWQSRVLELRGAYVAAHIPMVEWAVSSSPTDKRRISSSEPDVEAMIDIWKAAKGGDYEVVDWAAGWRERWKHY